MRIRVVASSLALSLVVAFAALGAGTAVLENPFESLNHPQLEYGAYIVRQGDGKVACGDATPAEARLINRRLNVPLRVFGEDRDRISANAGGGGAGMDIILRGTAQLDANPQAKAAFERAAAIWEARIANPITVYVDVDYGSTSFGEPFGENTIAQASSDYRGGAPDLYAPLRALLVARADNAAEAAIYALLPTGTVLTDLGATTVVAAPSMGLRAVGALPAAAATTDGAPRISFNSAFNYDFDPSNGITPGQTDFEGVVVHEIGHMLGFVSTVGFIDSGAPNLTGIFDWFRFRPGVTTGSFTSAQRVQSPGGDHVHFAGGLVHAMSTARGDGTGGDGQQASHWKDDAQSGTRIGIMDPTLSAGARSELTAADLLAFDVMGYTIVSGSPSGPAAPTNLTATATSSTVIRLNWTDNSTNETEFRIEQKVGANFVDIGSAQANATQINVTNFTAGQTGTFRVRARSGSVDSAYSNEASATTPASGGGCTPNATTVCLLNNRFRVKIDYVNPFSNPPNQPGTFLAARLNSTAGINPDVALFGFSSAQAVEVVVRIQDTRPFAPRFDVYYGGMTDVGYTVTVTDTQTGTTRQYVNQAGTVGGGVDRNSFLASALGSPDRIITSGGMDSFYDDSLVAASAVKPMNPQRIVETATVHVQPSKPARNAGSGGACSEIEPNNTTLLADPMALGEPCTGTAAATDSFNYTVESTSKIHDVFRVTTPGAGTVTVTLTFSNPAADLDIFLFSESGTTLTLRGFSVGTTTTETFTTPVLAAGTYYVGVSAFAGSSSYSVQATSSVSGGPAAPSNLTATATSSSVIRLNWNDNSNNETEFRVEQKVNANFVDIGASQANTTQINVAGFSAGSTGTFRIRARNGSGDSAYSNEATATTPGAPGACVANGTTVCLLSNRFRVSIAYVNPFSNPPNQPGTFLAARLNTTSGINPDVALFGFGSAQAVEVVVRVQDTRPFAPRFDIYYGGMTDVGYTVTVTDTQTGTTRQYTNTAGTVGGGVDRNSFPAN
jgi:hypothetical protein